MVLVAGGNDLLELENGAAVCVIEHRRYSIDELMTLAGLIPVDDPDIYLTRNVAMYYIRADVDTLGDIWIGGLALVHGVQFADSRFQSEASDDIKGARQVWLSRRNDLQINIRPYHHPMSALPTSFG